MARKHPQRRRKLIKPGLQLRLTGVFLGVALMCFVMQLLMVALALSEVANALPSGNGALQEAIPDLLTRVFLMSALAFLPLILLVGVTATFRIAGPIYRFEQYLRAVAAGTESGPCRIRKGDELHELCEIINAATEPLRRSIVDGVDGAEGAADERRAA
jgi:signal peptidase II